MVRKEKKRKKTQNGSLRFCPTSTREQQRGIVGECVSYGTRWESLLKLAALVTEGCWKCVFFFLIFVNVTVYACVRAQRGPDSGDVEGGWARDSLSFYLLCLSYLTGS